MDRCISSVACASEVNVYQEVRLTMSGKTRQTHDFSGMGGKPGTERDQPEVMFRLPLCEIVL